MRLLSFLVGRVGLMLVLSLVIGAEYLYFSNKVNTLSSNLEQEKNNNAVLDEIKKATDKNLERLNENKKLLEDQLNKAIQEKKELQLRQLKLSNRILDQLAKNNEDIKKWLNTNHPPFVNDFLRDDTRKTGVQDGSDTNNSK